MVCGWVGGGLVFLSGAGSCFLTTPPCPQQMSFFNILKGVAGAAVPRHLAQTDRLQRGHQRVREGPKATTSAASVARTVYDL